MDEEIERLVVSVRADTGAFARDVAAMKANLDGPLAEGLQRAGLGLESALLRAVRTGKLEFDDLKRVALSAMAEIAQAALRNAIGGGVQGGGSSGLLTLATSLIGAFFGAPGRATGGPVTAGRPYMVGERGPELFVPTAHGRIETGLGGARDVRVRIDVHAQHAGAPEALSHSSRQVARAVRAALSQTGD